jgi:hypothetical protein
LGFSNFSKDFLIRSGANKPIGKKFGSPRTPPEKGKGEEDEVRGTAFLRVRNRVFCAKFVISSREESLRVKDRIKFLIYYAIGCETHCTLLVCDSYLEKLIVWKVACEKPNLNADKFLKIIDFRVQLSFHALL